MYNQLEMRRYIIFYNLISLKPIYDFSVKLGILNVRVLMKYLNIWLTLSRQQVVGWLAFITCEATVKLLVIELRITLKTQNLEFRLIPNIKIN